MAEAFKPIGVMSVVPGFVLDEQGETVGQTVKIQLQGGCQPMERSREGLAQMQVWLLDAAAALGAAMVTAPLFVELQAEALAEPAMPKIVTATAVPDLGRMGLRQPRRG